jgi:hypothetical protein
MLSIECPFPFLSQLWTSQGLETGWGSISLNPNRSDQRTEDLAQLSNLAENGK